MQIQLSVKISINLVFRNNDTELLMIQESKEHSRGMWFLPAGKGREGELINETCIRETIEESGVSTKPIYLLRTEHVIRHIYLDKEDEKKPVDIFRYVFVSEALDNNLKTVETEDSIQAKWFPVEEIKNLPLRSIEVLSYIESFEWQKKKNALAKVEDIFDAYND